MVPKFRRPLTIRSNLLFGEHFIGSTGAVGGLLYLLERGLNCYEIGLLVE